jgi:outer membrane protein
MKLATLSLVALLGTVSAQEAQLKVATVDMQTLFKNFHLTAEMQKENGTYQQSIAKENNDEVKKLQDLLSESEALKKQIEDPQLADSKKQVIYTQWQAKQQELTARDRQRLELLDRKQAALNDHVGQQVKEVYAQIRVIVDEYAKSQGYDFVFDKSSNSVSQFPIMLYSKDATDITNAILKDLNKDAPEGFTLPATPETIK